jgi:hypothetical protein
MMRFAYYQGEDNKNIRKKKYARPLALAYSSDTMKEKINEWKSKDK